MASQPRVAELDGAAYHQDMLKKLLSHATAFLASFAIAFSAVITFWILPFLVRTPNLPGRGMILRGMISHPFGQGVLAAAGAALVLLPFRKRLRDWNVMALSRTALVGGLAGAIWSPSTHVMYWLSRAVDIPVGTKGYVAFPIICGAISSVALFFPWMISKAQPSELRADRDRVLGMPLADAELVPDDREELHIHANRPSSR